jgi:hypothetical protein
MNITMPVEMTLSLRMRMMRLALRWLGWGFRLSGLFLLAGGLLAFRNDFGNYVGIAIAAIALVFPEAIAVLVHLRSKRFGTLYTYTLTDDVVRVRTAVTNLEISWTMMKAVRERPADWSFRFSGGGSMSIPKDAFTPEQDAEWRAFATARGLTEQVGDAGTGAGRR